MAELIQEATKGKLVSLELQNPYPEDYDAIVKKVARENETGFLPPLKTEIVLSQYDTVFLGFPTWGMQLPPPVKTLLATANLEGKVVIPFNTNGGYGVGSSFEQVRDLCEGCRILEGFTTRGGSERDGVYLAIRGQRREQVRREVTDWLKGAIAAKAIKANTIYLFQLNNWLKNSTLKTRFPTPQLLVL